MSVKTSHTVLEVALLAVAHRAKVTAVFLEVAVGSAYSAPGAVTGASVSQVVAEVAFLPSPVSKVSQVVAEVAFRDADSFRGSSSYPIIA